MKFAHNFFQGRAITMDCQDYITESVERKKGQHLQREERGAIQHLKNAGYTNRAIARAIGCSPTTVGNELKRGTPPRKSSKGRKPKRGCSPKIIVSISFFSFAVSVGTGILYSCTFRRPASAGGRKNTGRKRSGIRWSEVDVVLQGNFVLQLHPLQGLLGVQTAQGGDKAVAQGDGSHGGEVPAVGGDQHLGGFQSESVKATILQPARWKWDTMS